MKKQRNPRFSIRSWSTQLGVSAMTLSRVLRGVRKCEISVLTHIGESLQLNEQELRYLHLLNDYEFAKTEFERKQIQELLRERFPFKSTRFCDLDEFKVIDEWFHLSILEMLQLKDFKSDYEYVAKRLGHGLTVGTIRAAIDRLVRLNLIKQTSTGRWIRVPEGRVKAGDMGASESIKKFHEQMLRKAYSALREQSLEEQSFSGTTISIKTEDIPRLKNLVNQFHRQIVQNLATNEADETYHVNLNFFRLTSPKVKNA